MIEILPALPLFAGALLALFVRGYLRAAVLLAAPLLGAYGLWSLEPGALAGQLSLMGYDLQPVRVDRLSLLFGYLFHLAAFLGVIYALHVKDSLQDAAALAYAGSAVGAVFAGDLLTLFVYWELLALTSAGLVFARRSPRSTRAGLRYLLVQVAAGVLLLAGVILFAGAGDLTFGHIGLEAPGGWLIFLAFGIKAAFPLLHSWLIDAYPESTPTGTVFLSAFTTKVAVYALARGFAGTELLIYIGTLMACFPIFYAVIENDLRRVLAYSLINQLGFMVVGVGVGTELALNGAVAHAFNDVLFKGLLMMSMGAVLHVTGEVRGSELGGLYKKMPKTAVLCLVGAASISAFPLFNGFVSKSLVVAAVLREGHDFVWLGLLFAAAGVFHHAGIKIPYFAFFHHDSRFVASAHEPPANMLIAMALAAALCVGIGCFPSYLYALLPYPWEYWPYDVSHVLAQLQLLAFSALAFTWLNLAGIYPPELRSVNLDADWLYRRVLPEAAGGVLARAAPIDLAVRRVGVGLLASGVQALARHHGTHGLLARTWPTGSMVLWVAILLGLSLLLYYF